MVSIRYSVSENRTNKIVNTELRWPGYLQVPWYAWFIFWWLLTILIQACHAGLMLSVFCMLNTSTKKKWHANDSSYNYVFIAHLYFSPYIVVFCGLWGVGAPLAGLVFPGFAGVWMTLVFLQLCEFSPHHERERVLNQFKHVTLTDNVRLYPCTLPIDRKR